MVNAGESVSASIKVTAFVVESTGLITGDMIATDTDRSPFDTFLLHRSLTDNQSLQLSWVYPDNQTELIETPDIIPEQVSSSLSRIVISEKEEAMPLLRIIYTDN